MADAEGLRAHLRVVEDACGAVCYLVLSSIELKSLILAQIERWRHA